MEENNQSEQPAEAVQTNNNDLLATVRERALSALTEVLPELNNIDPEQKFLISISALRSTDKLSLLEPALQAALSIEDKETRANSLLELINETNYLIDSSKPAAQQSSATDQQ